MKELTSRKVILDAINDPQISKSMNGVVFEDNNSDVFRKEALEAFISPDSTFHWDSDNSTLEAEYRKKVLIKNLKKNDNFIFNNILFSVTRKFKNEEQGLIAIHERTHEKEEFSYDELEVIKA